MIRKTFIILSFTCCLAASSIFAQVAVRTTSLIKVNGTLATNASITNNSATPDLSAAHLILLGTAQQLATTSPLIIAALTIDQGGTKTFSGDWHITNSLTLQDGIVSVPDGAKILYSGTDAVEGSDNSYVLGFFYTKGTGRKFFPVGSTLGYSPAAIEGFAGDEIGMRVVLGDVGFTLPADVVAYFDGHYWEADIAPGAPVSLSLNGVESFLAGAAPVILQSETSGTASVLDGSISSSFITSDDNAINTRLGIGKKAEFSLVIHDMITPFNLDEKNDRLFIENIELTARNKVKLVDRWGLVAVEFNDYNNDTEYDFSTLSPGNYVCLVEFSYAGETSSSLLKGVVTVLKTK